MNNVCLIGRLTRDPELRYTPSGAATVRINIAVDRGLSKEKRDEAQRNNYPTADFISCTAWNRTAETIANYVRKGQRIGIQGRIQTGSYEKDGRTVYTTEVVVDRMEFLESAGAQNTQMQRPTMEPMNQPMNSAYSNNNFNQPQNNFGGGNDFSDDTDGFFPIDNEDIPF